jgi:hypothetical protein
VGCGGVVKLATASPPLTRWAVQRSRFVNVTEPVADLDYAAVGQSPVGESHCQHWLAPLLS